MLTLAFETSAKAASVALTENGKLLGESYQNTGLTHSQTLMVMAEDLLKQCGKTVADITAVAVAEGPGSFTGVRIGVAAAKGMSWGAELPCYGVSTLEAMAHQAGCFEGLAVCAMDARRDQIYHAVFSCEGGALTRVREDGAVSLDEAAQALKNEKNKKGNRAWQRKFVRDYMAKNCRTVVAIFRTGQWCFLPPRSRSAAGKAEAPCGFLCPCFCWASKRSPSPAKAD